MHIVTTDFSLLPGEVKSNGVPEERCICSEPTALMIELHSGGWTEVHPYKIGRANSSFGVWRLNNHANLSNRLNHTLFLPTF